MYIRPAGVQFGVTRSDLVTAKGAAERGWGEDPMSVSDVSIRRVRRRLLTAMGLLAVAAVTWLAGPAAAAPAEGVIVLPGASSAEGVAVGRGSTFYAGELFGGDIFRGDLQRGTAELFIDAPPDRMALGLKVDDSSGLLFVAGGFTGQGYVYDAITGAAVATYQFGTPGASIINDVVITRDGAWFTDSVQPKLYFVPIGPAGVPGDFSALTLTGPAADITGDFNLNGIAATPDGRTLIVAHSTNEALYTVDPLTGASELLVDGVAPDGILYEAGRLWVAEPFLNQVTRLRPNPDLTDAVVEKVITSDLFQTPTTVAVHGDQLVAVNAKFDTGFPPTADEYEVVLVKR
jgi:sugar lactone lactonase YvrE